MAGADQPRLGQDRADGEFGNRGGIAAGRIDDGDAALLAGGDIDIDRPAAGDRDQLEMLAGGRSIPPVMGAR